MKTLDDKLQAEQTAAGAEAIKSVLRRLVTVAPDVKVRQLDAGIFDKLATECISAYVNTRARQAKEYGSLLDNQGAAL